MDTNVLFNIGCGLYLLTANEEGRDNGCIINTVMQVTQEPCQIMIAVNKNNFTTGMIQRTRKFNISILNEGTKFDVIENFGYKSGSETNKFVNFNDVKRALNGVLRLNRYANSYMSAYVQKEIDLGTHIMFIAQLVEAEVLDEAKTLTYDYYQKHIKPAPITEQKKGWICKICNYVYEGEEIPADYICPICKHGVSDFIKI